MRSRGVSVGCGADEANQLAVQVVVSLYCRVILPSRAPE